MAPLLTLLPPLSLYVHIPWCVRKCPYCDFNSHTSPQALPVRAYLKALKHDLWQDRALAGGRKIGTVFFGGGTPSLFPSAAIGEILDEVNNVIGFTSDAEITLEANPGSAEYPSLFELRHLGVNRLSIGVQSFNDTQLQKLGRIHSKTEAVCAFDKARAAGFDNINIDLMHGLPMQSTAAALADLEQAIALAPEHVSWYQLTIEKNTVFYRSPPVLPVEDTLADIAQHGQRFLDDNGYIQYEVSAYAKAGRQARHNINYWQFGDYLAIGAGAHGKITRLAQQDIVRYRKTRMPDDYLNNEKKLGSQLQAIAYDELALEFMMNAMRLNQGVDSALFTQRTGLPIAAIADQVQSLQKQGLMQVAADKLVPTEKGRAFLNNILQAF